MGDCEQKLRNSSSIELNEELIIFKINHKVPESKTQIIEYIANNHLVEEITKNITGYLDDDYKDLIQDIYVDLYTKKEDLLQNLYDKGNIKFFLTRIICNNIFSKTSRFYTQYKKINKFKVPIDDVDTTKL